jgi:hypothetical protein
MPVSGMKYTGDRDHRGCPGRRCGIRKEKRMDLKGILLWGGLAIICGAIWFFSRRIKKEIEENGILVPGVISRIVESADPEDPDEDCYVRYQTREGEEIEGLLSNPAAGLEVGQKVWIKYHPKLKQNCRLA